MRALDLGCLANGKAQLLVAAVNLVGGPSRRLWLSSCTVAAIRTTCLYRIQNVVHMTSTKSTRRCVESYTLQRRSSYLLMFFQASSHATHSASIRLCPLSKSVTTPAMQHSWQILEPWLSR